MNTSKQSMIRFSIILLMMLLAAFTRLIPHPMNFTAVLAIALFGGAKFRSSSLAIVLPLVVMLITDFFIGFYSLMPVVYSCIAITAIVGKYVGRTNRPAYIVIASIVCSLFFFLVTNAAVWYNNPMYATNLSGLMKCYDIAIPFFRNQIFGDLFFNFMLFGSYKLVKTKIPALAYA